MRRPLTNRIVKIKWLIMVAIFFSNFSVSSQSEVRPEPPPNSVLMFVAAWCAPCLTELAQFDVLEAAARPRRLLIVALDEGGHISEMTRRFATGQRLALAPKEAWDLFRQTSNGHATGLPYAVMIDAAGKPCATRNYALNEAELRKMTADCTL